MTKLAVVFTAAGLLLAAPTFSTSASAETLAGIKLAQADVRVKVREDRGWNHRHHRHCATKVIYRHGHKTVVKRCD
jgi:hypothetical protein